MKMDVDNILIKECNSRFTVILSRPEPTCLAHGRDMVSKQLRQPPGDEVPPRPLLRLAPRFSAGFVRCPPPPFRKAFRSLCDFGRLRLNDTNPENLAKASFINHLVTLPYQLELGHILSLQLVADLLESAHRCLTV